MDPEYESAPVCGKPSHWMRRDGNGRSMLNRFVLDKCDLQMNYNIWSPLLDGKTVKDEMQGRAIILKETVALSDQISQHSLL